MLFGPFWFQSREVVCLRERERERESVCVREREREEECVCVCLMCVRSIMTLFLQKYFFELASKYF